MSSTLSNYRLQPWQEVKAPYSIGYRIKLLSQLLTRQFQDKLEPYGLTPFHWLVLCCLWEQDGLATSDLGERLCQVGGTLTGVIDRMEERNLVRRERDQRDRRIWRIWLTEDGQKLEDSLPPVAMEVLEQALEGLSDQDRQQLSQSIDTLIANLS